MTREEEKAFEARAAAALNRVTWRQEGLTEEEIARIESGGPSRAELEAAGLRFQKSQDDEDFQSQQLELQRAQITAQKSVARAQIETQIAAFEAQLEALRLNGCPLREMRPIEQQVTKLKEKLRRLY